MGEFHGCRTGCITEESVMNKVCTKCGVEKPDTEFRFTGRIRNDGFQPRKTICNTCRNGYYRAWAIRSRFAQALITTRTAAKQRGYAPCTASKIEIESSFTGRCSICGTPESECYKRLNMDHSHTTGVFRGWLCNRCNQAIGLLRDSPEIALKLTEYLGSHQTVS